MDDPKQIPRFRETVLECGACFMNARQAATVFHVSISELDEMCKKEFSGWSASDVLDWAATMSDMEVRKSLKRLLGEGNQTAMNIYTTYIDKMQKADAKDAATIKVVALGQANQAPDDGGVTMLPTPDDDGEDDSTEEEDGRQK